MCGYIVAHFPDFCKCRRITSGFLGIITAQNPIQKGMLHMKDMFCFQCQQTAHNTGCEGKAGVCGKKADTANY